MAIAVVLSMAVAIFTLAAYSHSEKERRAATMQRRIGAAVSFLDTCQSVEALKSSLYTTVENGIRQLPTLEYYKRRPDELATALKSQRLTLQRFTPSDCYALPTVKSAGLRPPHRPAK
jgi:hypothetical protein